MKKLLLMVPMLHQGGFERVAVATARLLKDRYDVTILIFSDQNIHYDITGLKVKNIDVPSVPGTAGKIRNVFRRVQRVRAFKKEWKPDITYSFGSANRINALTHAGDRIITGLRCQTDLEQPGEVRFFLKKSDMVLSCSRDITRQLIKDYHYPNAQYIYNPLDAAAILQQSEEPVTDFPFEEELKTPGHEILISAGRNDRIKGFWHLIKAVNLLKETHPRLRLIILGAGKFEDASRLAAELGIQDRVAIPGVRRNPFPYERLSDCYVISSNREGFPNALLEAMALGKPLVAADCKTGPREIILSDEQYDELSASRPDGSSIKAITEGRYGILVPDMDSTPDYDASHITKDDHILATAIDHMLSDQTKMQQFGIAASSHAKDYSPERYRDSLIRILESI